MGTIAKHRTPLARSRQRLHVGPPTSPLDRDCAPVGPVYARLGREEPPDPSTAGWALRLLRALWLAPGLSPRRASRAREDEHLPHPA
jgi:hypothetical protein